MQPFDEHVQLRLQTLRAADLLRTTVVAANPAGTHVEIAGRRLLNLCSNNYLGLTDHPELLAATSEAARHWGGAAASRLVTGTLQPHRDAESALARYVGFDDARLFTSGYAANVGTVSGLVGPGDILFSDSLNHASLIDGARLSRARIVVYPHGDLHALRSLLAEHRPSASAALILTDAVFSMDGDVADLRALRALADEFSAGLLVDEAHSLGVLGAEGRGLAAQVGIRADVTTGMLGKSFGLGGGFVAAASDTLRLLDAAARSFVFSTGIHAAIAAAVPTAIRLVRAADARRTALRAHRALLSRALDHAPTEAPPTPILPVHIGASTRALAVSAYLEERGVFARAIRPPTVPQDTARLRVVPIATHTTEDIARAADLIAAALREVP